jgi:membrane-associated phospholipid phosphatase
MFMFFRLKRLLPVEKVLTFYLVLTFACIIFLGKELEHISPHLFFRVTILIILFILPIIEEFFDNPATMRAIRIFFPFLLLPYLYNETDYLNNLIFQQNLDPFFSHIEGLLFGTQPSLEFSVALHNNFFADLMYFGYFSYYLLILCVPAFIFFSTGRETGQRFAFIIISSFLIYYFIFILFPVAGPQFYYRDFPGQLPKGYIFSRIMRTIQAAGEGETAAFPSSHISICLMLLWGSFRYARRLLPYIIPAAIILMFSTVYLRAHYVIDIMAGALTAPFIWQLTSLVYDRMSVKTEALGGAGIPDMQG